MFRSIIDIHKMHDFDATGLLRDMLTACPNLEEDLKKYLNDPDEPQADREILRKAFLAIKLMDI